MEGMNASNCHPGLHIIAQRSGWGGGGERIRSSQSHLVPLGLSLETDEGKALSSSASPVSNVATHQRWR